MTKIKLCGLSRIQDIQVVNKLKPEYIGFVFATKSKRYVTPKQAKELRANLTSDIQSVGVFVDENPEVVVSLLEEGIIDIAQLHGTEDEEYIELLRKRTDKPLIQAFRIRDEEDIQRAVESSADAILLDSGAGTGTAFDWNLIKSIERPYFLAGGLGVDNVREAVDTLRPYAVDVSSGIESDGKKDDRKMAAFVAAVRKEETL